MKSNAREICQFADSSWRWKSTLYNNQSVYKLYRFINHFSVQNFSPLRFKISIFYSSMGISVSKTIWSSENTGVGNFLYSHYSEQYFLLHMFPFSDHLISTILFYLKIIYKRKALFDNIKLSTLNSLRVLTKTTTLLAKHLWITNITEC